MQQQSDADALQLDGERLTKDRTAAAHNAIGAIQWNYDRTEIIADGVIH